MPEVQPRKPSVCAILDGPSGSPSRLWMMCSTSLNRRNNWARRQEKIQRLKKPPIRRSLGSRNPFARLIRLSLRAAMRSILLARGPKHSRTWPFFWSSVRNKRLSFIGLKPELWYDFGSSDMDCCQCRRLSALPFLGDDSNLKFSGSGCNQSKLHESYVPEPKVESRS